jgi:ATP-dependent exoDNAse (exonuclease V) beta subunit
MKEKINNLDFDLTEEIKSHKEYVEILNNEIRNKLLLYDGELFKIEDGGITDILGIIAENKVSKFYRFIKDPFSVKEYIEKFNVFKGNKRFVNDEINKFLDVIKQKYNYEFLKTQEEQLNILKTIKSKINLTKISLRLLEILQDIKMEENVMFFSDFTKKISEIIQNEENVDFIFEKVGTRYRNFLIDEFQDTSELQFQNLLPLLHNAMAEGNENFIVGDPKQSIYRWRNASIKQCIDLFVNKDISLKKLKDEWEGFKDKIKTEKLEFNYRSAKEIVEFNNDVFNNFEYKEEYESIKKVFGNCNQEVGETNLKGYVELAKLKDKKTINESLKIFSDYAFSVINDYISKGFQQKDICILARENKHINIIIENLKGKILCNGEELQFESAENGNLIKSEKVEFIVAFLNLLLDNQNKISNAICIKYYERKSFSEIINVDENFLKKFNDEKFKLYFDTSNILNVDIFQLIMRIIDYFEIEFDPSVQKLISVANTFMHQYATQNNTIQGFLQFWNENASKISININKNTNAVKIMTIHKSKGLEFPVVLYFQHPKLKDDDHWYKINAFDIQPYNDNIAKILDSLKNIYFYLNISDIKNINNNDASVLEEEKILEELNLIYVAYTRAINRLHVFVKDDVYFPKIENRLSLEKYSQDDSKSENYRIISYGNSDFQKQSLKTSENTDIDISDIQLKYNHNILIADSSNPYSDAHELGIKVHKVLELLNDNNLEKTLKKAYIKGYINHSDIEKIRHIIFPLLENSELKRYFESENIQYILSEIEIFGKDKETYRPDKLIFTKDKEIIVLEFKSGKEEDKHKQQLKNYIQLISELYKDFKVKGFLLYLREDKILIKREE